MRNKSFVDCFMLMGTALSIKGPVKSIEVNRPIIQDVFTNLVTLSLEIENFKVFDLKYMVRDEICKFFMAVFTLVA